MQLPQISPQEVLSAAREWKTNGGRGISIVVDDIHAQFTADFTNMVLAQAYGALISELEELRNPKNKIVIAES